jgi:hypothetical protein
MAKKKRANSMRDPLRKWINDPENMHGREAILMHRLCFDVQCAAARNGYYLNTYYDDVDHDGFDLILDDHDTLKKTQVKSVETKAETGQWDIHKRLLRPSFELIDKLGFEASPESEGTAGGFVLMRFDTQKPEWVVEYFYTDLFVWMAFECQVIRRRDGRSQAAIKNCLKSLQTGLGNEVVKVPRALMLHARGPDELLALAGLHSQKRFDWKHHVIQIANHMRPNARPKMELSQSLDGVKRTTAAEIRELALDADLLDGRW